MLHLKEGTTVNVSCYYSKEHTDDYKKWLHARRGENEDCNSSLCTFSDTRYSIRDGMPLGLFKDYINTGNSNYNNMVISFNVCLREVISILTQHIHNGSPEYFFICNPEFSEALAKSTGLGPNIAICYNFGNKNSASLLISYLEINGVAVEHIHGNRHTNTRHTNTESSGTYSWDIAHDSSADAIDDRHDLLIHGKPPSLFHSVNQTSTDMGKRGLFRRIIEPFDSRWMQKSLNFIQKFRNNPALQKVSEILKKTSTFDVKVPEKSNEVELGTSFLMDQSTNDSKSIYSRNNLEENSISRYKRMIKNVESIKNSMEAFSDLRNEIERLKIEKKDADGCTFSKLAEALSETSIVERINAQLDDINSKTECVCPFLADKIGFVVKSDVDSYLDMCRRMYEEKLMICQGILNEIQMMCDLEIYFGDDREICLMKINSCEKNGAKVHGSTLDSYKSSHKNSSTALDNASAFQDSTTKSKQRIKPKKHVKLFILKESKTMVLYSCPELRSLNKIIRDLIDQIVEIEGRICKSILLKIQQYDKFFAELCSLTSELDILISNSIVSKELQFKRPRAGCKVAIYNASHILFPEFQRSSYVFENNEIYVITGANMAGKSCYLRNLLHTILLSKIGCFINCDSAEIPTFDEVYFINSTEDINALTQRILNRAFKTEEDYKTPARLVLIDELHCCSKIQLELLHLLRNSRVLTLFVTHRTGLISKLKEEGFKILSYENFQLKEGVSSQSSVLKICERYFPEILSSDMCRNRL